MNDLILMKKAISLAKKGTGYVSPNPRVGAVVVKEGQVISTGYHKNFGGYHAEVMAIKELPEEKIQNSTLYVNLEPCSHTGKTPPCTDLIIQSGIQRVVIGCEDPNPLVRGSGIKKLLDAGIQVATGVAEKESILLNEAFFKYIQTNMPFVTLKAAQTLDGHIASSTGASKWITGEESRKYVHRLRREHDAVLVGINTVKADNPQLNVRHGKGPNPFRIVLDSQLSIPLDAKIINCDEPGKTIVVTSEKAPSEAIERLIEKRIQVWTLPVDDSGKIQLNKLLNKCIKSGIISLFIEGGQQIFTQFVLKNIWDRMIVCIAPKLFGTGLNTFGNLNIVSPENAITFESGQWFKKGNDMIFEGRP